MKEEHKKNIDDLTNMFYINPEILNKVKIKFNATNEEILTEIYKQESLIKAKKNIEIKNAFEQIKELKFDKKEDTKGFTKDS